MTTLEAEIVCGHDKVEPLIAKLIAHDLAIEEIIDWPDCTTIVAMVNTGLEPYDFYDYVRAIVAPFAFAPGDATLMHVEPVDRPIPLEPKRRRG